MKTFTVFSVFFSLVVLLVYSSCIKKSGVDQMSFIKDSQISQVIDQLVKVHGENEYSRIERGVKQVAKFWRKEDGKVNVFSDFCSKYYISDFDLLQKTVDRYEKNLESVIGHLHEIYRDLSEPMHLDIGPMLPVDYLFAEYSTDAHVNEDFFKLKIAFVALLNFPLYTLEEISKFSPNWSREEWRRARLPRYFSERVPSEVEQEINKAYVTADDYISNYNIYMHHVLNIEGKRLFPPGLKLISHWGLRDELKAQYAYTDGLPKQEIIQKIMEKIIRQEIPNIVINNPAVDWNLETNEVTISPVKDVEGSKEPESINNSPEPNSRYTHFLEIFRAERKADPYFPTTPTLMDRMFLKKREIPEATVEKLFKTILSSPLISRTAKIIEKRLGRKLRPFDIWYNGFEVRSIYQESELDRIVSKKFPTIEAFQKGIPKLLGKLGFSRKTADFLASKIKVDPARGVGHAMGAGHRSDNAHLRTRVPSGGMNYKGYNIAIHELGHNCEQVLSLNRVDHTLLQGVPNTGFTEAFAFVFQSRDLELLGLTKKDPMAEHLKALNDLWSTYEIGAVSLVDMAVWHWMYEHPDAAPEELKKAVIEIAQDLWNNYFAPVFGTENEILLAVYSHMIDAGLYLPDYPLGHIIAFQIEEYLKDKNIGIEMERMCRLGSITPDVWMKTAVGESISAEPMLKAAENALTALEK